MKPEDTLGETDCIKPLIKTAVMAVRGMLQFGVRACDETLKILGEERVGSHARAEKGPGRTEKCTHAKA